MDDNGAIYLGIPDPSVEGMPADVIGMDKDEAKTAVENASNNKIEVILEPRFSAKKDFGKIVASNYIFGAPFEASNEENDYKIWPFAVWCGWVCQVVTVLRSSLPQVRQIMVLK